jgi:RimJ/RimL family protein N-acetyltransferase
VTAAAARPKVNPVPYDGQRHGDGPWRVVAAVFEEYGFPFAESDYDADLADPATYYDGTTGWFSVVEDDGGLVVGCVGLTDEGEACSSCTGCTCWHRRGGAGRERAGAVGTGCGTERGARKVILFSDVHFEDAHRLYRRFGFCCTRFRYAPDPWQSREWGFELDLGAGR